MKIYINLLIAFILFSLVTGCTNASAQTFVEKDHGDDIRQGLKYVNEQAIEFIKAHNLQYQTNFRSLQPDPRIMVYKCLVPMHTKWVKDVPDTIGVNHNIWYLQVSCSKTTAENIEDKQWTIDIPTTRPKEFSKQKSVSKE